jgi:hypothetical protein
MIGGASIGEHAVGEFIEAGSAPLTFNPVSRITSGGTFQVPAYVPVVGVDLIFDDADETEITWDTGDNIVLENGHGS